jgi:glycosyltransferase involved in cell wall biosynthesis
MRIALIAPEFLPNWGGVGTYSLELSKYISRRNDIELHVITLIRSIGGITYTEPEILSYFDNRIHVHVLGDARETFLYNIGFQYRVSRELPGIVRDYGIDVIHSQHAHMPDLFLKLRKINAASVVTIHSTVRTQYEGIRAAKQPWSELDASEKYELMLHPMLEIAERFYLSRSMNLICVSNWTRNHLESHYLGKSVKSCVIHNGVDSDTFRPDRSSRSQVLPNVDDPIVLYASRLTAARGAYLLARAIPRILEKNKRVHFVFVGAGRSEQLVAFLRKSGVPATKFTILGYVKYDELPDIYARAYVYVAPTSWENFPFKILEAMSSGKPVITTNVGGISEVIKDSYNGIFTSRNSAAIAQDVIRLLDNAELARELGRNARDTILRDFTWEKTGERTKRFYEHLAS